MKKFRKLAAIIAAIVVITAVGAVFAAEFKTPAEIVSGLTGKSIESLDAERAEGNTYGSIAAENGKLDEFKAQMLEQKKAILDQRVADGKLTREKADEIYNTLKEKIASCDGTGTPGMGREAKEGMRAGARAGAKAGAKAGARAGNKMNMKANGIGRGMNFCK